MSHTNKDLFKKGDKLLNNVDLVSKSALNGCVIQYPHLALLDIGDTIVRNDYDTLDRVKILSGGPSGYEPLYWGFVGQGFLTASIQGDIFTSPSSDLIYNVIKELSFRHTMGVLIIIQNNSGDILNFGLAVEKAQSEGFKVRLLIVSDDCSDVVPSNKTDQPAGLTGVILVQKIAASMAESFKSLTEIYDYCKEVLDKLSTIIIKLKPSNSPSDKVCICNLQSDPKDADVGGGLLSIGSPKRIKISTTEHAVEELINEITKCITLDDSTQFVLLINSFCVTKLEEVIFYGDVLKKLYSLNMQLARVYTGTFMTCYDAKGFTITLLKCDEDILKHLDAPTNAPEWKPSHYNVNPIVMKPRIRVIKRPRLLPTGPKFTQKQSNVLLIVLQFACDALISCERQLNLMDAENGDGDTGVRIRVVAEDILSAVYQKELNLECPYIFFKQLSRIIEKLGGTMAALYGMMFEAAAFVMQGLDESENINGKTWLMCLNQIIITLKSHTKTEGGYKNMLAPLMACAVTTETSLLQERLSGLDSFEHGVAAAEEASQKTKLARKMFPDSGAHSIAIWMRAVYEAVKFRCDF